jgi:hypothetical protein
MPPLHDGTDRLLEPIFGLYQILVPGRHDWRELAATGFLLRHWDVSVAGAVKYPGT